MYELFDRVLHKPSGKPGFVIDIDEGPVGTPEYHGPIYGFEAEDQYDPDWFYWAEEKELEKLPEHE